MELRFRIAGIPVRVEPGFWLVSALLGWGTGGIKKVLIWIACVFVGVLCHELGHAMAARAFGAKAEIILYSMGGLTSTSATRPLGRVRSIVLSFAGPFSGFLLGIVVIAIVSIALPADTGIVQRLFGSGAADASTLALAIEYLVWINIGWGAVNLIPVLPFDGGHVAQEVLGGGDAGWHRAAWVSVVIGPAVAAAAFLNGWTWAGLLFALSAIQTFRELMARRSRRADQKNGLIERTSAASEALESGAFETAAKEAEAILGRARSPELRRNATHVLAIARLRMGDPEAAVQALEKLPAGEADAITMGLCLLESGRAHEAARYFEVARTNGEERAEELLEGALAIADDPALTEEYRSRMVGQNTSSSGKREG